jgi:hypothetical protein
MRGLLAFVLCVIVSVSSARANQPEWWRNGGPRLRPQDPRVMTLLELGMLRSPTLRALVDRIEASDVFVYVGMSRTINARLAGCLTFMTKTDRHRYLRAYLNPDLSQDLLIAALAHELQHAVEVIDEPSVVDEKSLSAFYKRVGMPSLAATSQGWETRVAQATGQQVGRELVATRTTDVAELRSRERAKVANQ